MWTHVDALLLPFQHPQSQGNGTLLILKHELNKLILVLNLKLLKLKLLKLNSLTVKSLKVGSGTCKTCLLEPF